MEGEGPRRPAGSSGGSWVTWEADCLRGRQRGGLSFLALGGGPEHPAGRSSFTCARPLGTRQVSWALVTPQVLVLGSDWFQGGGLTVQSVSLVGPQEAWGTIWEGEERAAEAEGDGSPASMAGVPGVPLGPTPIPQAHVCFDQPQSLPAQTVPGGAAWRGAGAPSAFTQSCSHFRAHELLSGGVHTALGTGCFRGNSRDFPR